MFFFFKKRFLSLDDFSNQAIFVQANCTVINFNMLTESELSQSQKFSCRSRRENYYEMSFSADSATHFHPSSCFHAFSALLLNLPCLLAFGLQWILHSGLWANVPRTTYCHVCMPLPAYTHRLTRWQEDQPLCR